jgi:predicted MPP superfamily phosphohydrolase
MFVSRGIGTVYVPVRIGCPPEVSIVTLRRKAGF